MERLLYGAALLIALLLILGSMLIPGSDFMWMASTGLGMNIARGVIVVAMVVLLLTEPPRNFWLRGGLGLAALGLAATAVGLFIDNSVHLIDMLLCLQAAVSFGLAALEAEPDWELADVPAAVDPVPVAEQSSRLSVIRRWPLEALLLPVIFMGLLQQRLERSVARARYLHTLHT